MLAKIKLKCSDDGTPNQHFSTHRRNKSLLPRVLAISFALFVLILISIVYHGIVLEQFGDFQKLVKQQQSNNYKTLRKAENVELEVESSKSVIEIPDSEMFTLDGNNIIEDIKEKHNDYDNELQRLNIQHGQIKFSRHRLSRDLIDPLDPLVYHYDINLVKLKSRVRDKRTKIMISKLERDYVRCKKKSSHEQDCMMEFSKLYKVAKDLLDIFKESEIILQQSSKSIESLSNEMNDSDDEVQANITRNNTTENPNKVDDKLKITMPISITTATKVTPITLTTTTKKIKPVKYSWIIDGNDEFDEDINIAKTSPITPKSSSTLTKTTTSETTRTSKSNTDLENLEIFMMHRTTESVYEKPEIIQNQESTTKAYKWDSINIATKQPIKMATVSMETTARHGKESIPTTSMPLLSTSTNDVEVEKLRKMKFDWLVGRANFTKVGIMDDILFSTTYKTLTDAGYLTESTTSSLNWSVENEGYTVKQSIESPLGATTESLIYHVANSSADLQYLNNLTHPLDNPSSYENMLGSFETSGVLKPFVHQTSTNDSKVWAKTFQTSAVMYPQEELLNTFDGMDLENVNRMEPKLNPANMKTLSADDAELLTLCDRMTKRLRNKAASSNFESGGFIQTSNAQVTNRAPGGFPVTGESMKATAQFMFNPNFGMPSIPICFYLTPANFRMPNQMASMWPISPLYGMPSFYGASSGGLMAPGIGQGMGGGSIYFVPQSSGSTGNFFSSSGAANSQSSGQNIFPKSVASPQKQPQQFYCTYMQNNSNEGTNSNTGNGVGTANFLNSNFKSRTANQSNPLNIIYASYVGVPTQLDQKDQTKCELPDEIACFAGHECIRESSWCDNIVDCSDGSDEAACTCQDRLPDNRLCDGYSDCPMGEDEIGCFGCENYMYSCYANAHEYERFNRSTIAMCYNKLDKCDGIANCLNGRDELDCSILVKDLTQHMPGPVSSNAGFLYHNHRGDWFPVCNNGEKWAKDACRNEGGYIKSPSITFKELALPGPFIEPSRVGNYNFPHSCQKRNSLDEISDQATYVKCAASRCGNRKKNAETSLHPKSKRSSKHSKRIVTRDNASEEDEDFDVEAKDAERIVGGKYSKPLEWPFIVAIYRNGNFHCGGTIYNEHWIITAAHCAINYQKYYYEIRAGMLRRNSYSAATQIQSVSHVFVHQYYERVSMRNDLSLMRMAEPLSFNRWVKPICLPDIGRTTKGDDWIWGPEANTLCTTVGWGAIREKGPGSDQLREVVIPIRKRCKDRPDQESESICAGDTDGGRDACQGDSGGPLFCSSISDSDELYLAGVVSHGNGCARSGEYGVYTRVSLYLDWIEMSIKQKLPEKLQPLQECPGYVCIWAGKRCMPQRKRCNRVADCLGGEDEVGCVYNFIPDLGSALNSTTTESDYYPINESTTQEMRFKVTEVNTEMDATTTTETTTQMIETTFLTTTSTTEIETDSTFLETTEETTPTTLFVEEDTLRFDFEQETTDAPEVTTTVGTTVMYIIDGSGDFTTSGDEIISSIEMKETTKPPTKPTSTTPTTTRQPTILPGKFVCRKIQQIIEIQHRCDRFVDCEDGTDEENCNCRDYLKGSLSILVCDGKSDCEDGSDEDNCGHCNAGQFLCPLSKFCIPLKKRCDNIGDCQFKEDEKDCYALTNGKDVHHDLNKRPMFSNFGIFTRNTNGQWHTVCVHETSFMEHNAKTASDICTLLGFKGYKFYNTTNLISRDSIFDLPIDPDIVKQPRIKAHLAAAVEDNFHYSSNENLFPLKKSFETTKKSERIERTERVQSLVRNCHGIYVECITASDQTQPQKTLTAGNAMKPNATDLQKLKPLLKPSSRPNVYVKPESPTQIVSKKDKNIRKPVTIHGIERNLSILANNELHEAVEELHWPWLVDVYANGKLWCIGVLLNEYWIMVHESCYFGIRLNTDFVSALFGGGKTKDSPHKSSTEQVRRVDCFQSVPKSDIILYHLERPVYFSHDILPIFLPEREPFDYKRQCMAVLHDELTGLIKTVPIIEHKDDETCKTSERGCYRVMENTELMRITLETKDKIRSQARQTTMPEDTLLSALSNLTTCSQFGLKTFRNAIEPIDQGILVCRSTTDGWFPAALFSYNNTDCISFKQPFGIRTLEKLYDILKKMIAEPYCSITYEVPKCDTFRCPLGQCLSREEICNNKVDCHDGSDEDAMFCLEYRRGCQPWEMRCRSSNKCILKSKFCDHVPDCEDLIDEPTICSCFTYLKATDPAKICDGIRNCWDKTDESPVLCNCTSEHFFCGLSSNECIPRDFVCDKELDCPNGEDEKYCFGIEQPLLRPTHKNDPDHIDSLRPPNYGQVIEQSYGVWHTKCFPRSTPPGLSEIRQICKKLGYITYRQPSYRFIDDATSEVVKTNIAESDRRGRTFDNETISEKYRYSTKAVVVSKFSPIKLNDKLTIFMKPSRPIAEIVRWNATDSSRCFRLEINCM